MTFVTAVVVNNSAYLTESHVWYSCEKRKHKNWEKYLCLLSATRWRHHQRTIHKRVLNLLWVEEKHLFWRNTFTVNFTIVQLMKSSYCPFISALVTRCVNAQTAASWSIAALFRLQLWLKYSRWAQHYNRLNKLSAAHLRLHGLCCGAEVCCPTCSPSGLECQ